MKVAFEVYDAHTTKPNVNKLVLVCGGLATWNGQKWLSHMNINHYPIQWDVTWWMDIPHNSLDKLKIIR